MCAGRSLPAASRAGEEGSPGTKNRHPSLNQGSLFDPSAMPQNAFLPPSLRPDSSHPQCLPPVPVGARHLVPRAGLRACISFVYLSSGAKATPRNASPARAERMVANLSRCPSVAACVALIWSVTFTSLLGSAPLSPLLLIVEVIA